MPKRRKKTKEELLEELDKRITASRGRCPVTVWWVDSSGERHTERLQESSYLKDLLRQRKELTGAGL